MGFFVIAPIIITSDTRSNGTTGPHSPSPPLSTSSSQPLRITIIPHLSLSKYTNLFLSLSKTYLPIVSIRRSTTAVAIFSFPMAQKREKEETELKVPETLTLCTPSLPAATSKISGSGSDERRSSSPDRSDLKPGAAVDSRSSSASSPKRPDLDRKPRPATTEDDSHKVKRREINRCSGCRRKVGLMGFRCRCGEMFCSDHRYSDRHDCSYDYKAAGREAIARENPVVRAAKILKV